MTEDEINICTAFDKVIFLPGSWDKRFAMNMSTIAWEKPHDDITETQREWIYRLLYKYRRQMPETYEKHKEHPHCQQKEKR